jgi:hypothetical protein
MANQYSQSEIDRHNRYLKRYATMTNPTQAEKQTYSDILGMYGQGALNNGLIDASKFTDKSQRNYIAANPYSEIAKNKETRFLNDFSNILQEGSPYSTGSKLEYDRLASKWNFDPYQSSQPKQEEKKSPMQQMLDNLMNGQNSKPDFTSIEDLEGMYGFDYSREYAKKQAEAEAQALRNANADAQRRNSTNKEENLKAIDNNLMNMADALDRNYFNQYQQQRQAQANNGVTGGVQSEQDLRLAMSRQANMGEAYRDANLGIMRENNRFTNDDLRLAEALGLINQQALAREDSLYNERRQQGFNNAQVVDQRNDRNNSMNLEAQLQLLGMIEDGRRYDLEFGLKEGELTGSYVPSYLRGNPYGNPNTQTGSGGLQDVMGEYYKQMQHASNPNASEQERQYAKQAAEGLLSKMAANGMNVNSLVGATSLSDALKGAGNLNPTMSRRTLDQERYMFDKELAENSRQFDLGLQFQNSELAQQNTQFNNELAYKYKELETDKQLKSRGLDIDELKVDAEMIRTDLQVTEAESFSNTQYYIAQIGSLKSADEAWDYVADKSMEMVGKGVDVESVVDAIYKRFPSANTVYTQDQINQRDSNDSSPWEDMQSFPK